MMRLREFFGRDSYYGGTRGNWYVVYDYSRDASTLALSNNKAIRQLYKIDGISDNEFPADIAIERASHWAVGWIEYIIINPDNAEFVKIAENIRERLENYPILDDMLYSEMQADEFDKYLSDAMREYEFKYDREFNINKYHTECMDCAYDRDEIFISCADLERIEEEN